MSNTLRDRLRHAFNVFINGDEQSTMVGPSVSSSSSYRNTLSYSNERSIVAAIYNRIAIDGSLIEIQHIRKDDNDRFVETIDSGLQRCLTISANIDQPATAFRQDMLLTMMEHGHIAIVAVETSINPNLSGGYDVTNMRVGRVVQWFPQHVKVRLYDERTGERKDVILHKNTVAIVENPLYTVMNEPNSTLQRLVRKLNYLDAIDKQTSSGKLDIIIQLPYVVKSDARKVQAEERRNNLELQLNNSKYGVAYTDATEKVTQLNRPAENNLLKQIEMLVDMLYGELGITKEIMNGTADEKTMINYYNRTIDPMLRAIQESLRRTFLTKTAMTQHQDIAYFRDPFRLIEISAVAEIADKMTRNEILTSNEVRGIVGFKPVKDPSADELRNKNLPAVDTGESQDTKPVKPEGDNQNES